MRFRITFDVAGRWAHRRYEARKARGSSGSTSIRVSRSTLAKLGRLRRAVGQMHPEWHFSAPSLAELLDAIADGLLQVKKHASEDPDTHAESPRGESACKVAIAETHASNAGVDVHASDGAGGEL